MSYISFDFYIFLLVLLSLYYLPGALGLGSRKKGALPRFQNLVLLAGSLFFYCRNSSAKQFVLFLSTVVLSYWFGLAVAKRNGSGKGRPLSKFVLGAAISVVLLPMLAVRFFPLVPGGAGWNLIVPIGLSFYSLQIVAYLCDCASGKVNPERDFLRYSLFVGFFPYVIQGPIPRYERISRQLAVAHAPSRSLFVSGIQKIIWGFFLKYMIADKAAVFVDTAFSVDFCKGVFILVAAVLYSFQLYADFFACVSISQGVAELFGMQLDENFMRPYFALSVKDFWRRWHITLSTWLRDYVYIPLGGNRKGVARKYWNIIGVFLVSGVWHGTGLNFAVWGLMHGVYQIIGGMTYEGREKIYRLLGIGHGCALYRAAKRAGTFGLVTLAWIVFRAADLRDAWRLVRDAFASFDPGALFSPAFYSFGLDPQDWTVLWLSLAVLFAVGWSRERGLALRARFNRQHLAVRWAVYVAAIAAIWIFGSYGHGFDSADFIYGGF